jgi:hypothetical protein
MELGRIQVSLWDAERRCGEEEGEWKGVETLVLGDVCGSVIIATAMAAALNRAECSIIAACEQVSAYEGRWERVGALKSPIPFPCMPIQVLPVLVTR